MPPITIQAGPRPQVSKTQQGIDVFIEWDRDTRTLAAELEDCARPDFQLVMISNRGQKVYPGGNPGTFCVDHWRCRFQGAAPGAPVATGQVLGLLGRLAARGLPFIKTEGLYAFDGIPGYSLGQGQ